MENADPAPEVHVRHLTFSEKSQPCPQCGGEAKRHSIGIRRLRDLGTDKPTVLQIIHAKYYCPRCERHFVHPMEHLAPASAHYTHQVRRRAVTLVRQEKLSLNAAARAMLNRFHVPLAPSTLHDWLAAEKTSA